MRPTVVLSIAVIFVFAVGVALWLTVGDQQEILTAEDLEVPLPEAGPERPDRVPPATAPATPGQPKPTEPAATPATTATTAPDATVPGTALPRDQWPARLRPPADTIVSTPPPVDTPTVDKDDIREAIKSVTPLIKQCFTDAAEKNPGDQKVVLKFTIEGQGTSGFFKDGEVQDSSIADPWVQACFLEALTDAHFPAPKGGGIVTVTYPFKFTEAAPDGGATPTVP